MMHFTNNYLVDLIILICVLLIPITIVHELFHAAVRKLFGGKVRLGFKGVYAYTQEVTGIVLYRTKFLIVILAPVTFISIASLLFSHDIGRIIF